MEKIGIMGGTFDPIHYGHLHAAEEARMRFCLGRVIFIPTGAPPHKHYDGMASPEDRYEMTRLAIADNPFFCISRMETDRTGDSYTVDTLRALKADNPDSELFLIMGFDSILDFPNWRKPLEISTLCTIIVVNRPGYERNSIGELPDKIIRSMQMLDMTLLDISATDIRARIRAGRSVFYLLPEAVRGYIASRDLYSTSEGESH
jgi:nicotinate-nucleotide adenylyltransferase